MGSCGFGIYSIHKGWGMKSVLDNNLRLDNLYGEKGLSLASVKFCPAYGWYSKIGSPKSNRVMGCTEVTYLLTSTLILTLQINL